MRNRYHDFGRIILTLAFCILFPAFYLSAQNAAATPEQISAVKNVLGESFKSKYFTLENLQVIPEDGDLAASGDVTFFDKAGVQLKSILSGTNQIKSIEANFPEGTSFNPLQMLDKIISPQTLKAALPDAILEMEGIAINRFTISMAEGSNSMESFEAALSSDALDILEFGGLDLQNIQMLLMVTEADDKKVPSGQVSGGVDFGGQIINLSATISKDKEAIAFKGSHPNELKLGRLLEIVGGSELKQEFGKLAPAPMLDLFQIPAFEFELFPQTKTFSLSTSNTTGEQSIDVEKENGKFKFSFNYTPNVDFQFTEIDPGLSFIDDANIFEDLKIGITNVPKQGGPKVKGSTPGLEITAGLKPNDLLKKIFALDPQYQNVFPDILIFGSIDGSLNTTLAADLEFDFNLGDGWKIEKAGVFFDYKMGARSPMLGINGSMIIPMDGTLLRFGLGMFGEPASASIGGRIDLESVDDNGDITEWQEPFGIPFVSLTNLGGALAISGTTVLDRVEMRSGLKLGKIPSGQMDRRIRGQADITLDVDVTQTRIQSKVVNLNFLRIIQAFTDGMDIPGEVAKFLNTGIDTAYIDINPAGKSIAIKGDAVFMSLIEGTIDVTAGVSGFQAKGGLKPIRLAPGGFELFSLTAKDDPNTGPNFEVALNEDPGINFTGQMKILGINVVGSEFMIDKNGFMAEAKTGNEVLGTTLTLKGRNFFSTASMRVEAEIRMGVISALKDALIEFIDDQVGVVAAEIANTIIPELSIEKIKLSGGLDKFQTGMKAEVIFIAGIFGEREEFDVEVELNVDLSNPASYASAIPSLAGAIGLELIENFGDLAGMVFTGASKLAEKAFVAVGEGFIALAGEVGKAWEAIGLPPIEDPFTDKMYDKPVNGPALSVVPPGYRHFAITLDKIVVNSPDENNGDDVFGGILVESPLEYTFWAPKTNRNIFGRSEFEEIGNKCSGCDNGSTVWVSNTKHLYIKHNTSAWVQLKQELWEEDDWPDSDDHMTGQPDKVYLYNLSPSEGTYKHSFTVRDPESSPGRGIWTVHYTIKADPLITGEVLVANVKAGDRQALERNLRFGGDLKQKNNDVIFAAVKNRDRNMLGMLDVYDIKANVNELREAAVDTTTAYDPEFVYQVLKMLNPNQKPMAMDVDLAIKNGAAWLADTMVMTGATVNHDNLVNALNANVYGLAGNIMRKGVKPLGSDLDNALDKKDPKAMEVLLIFDVPVNSKHLTKAIEIQQWKMAEELLERTDPDQETFKKCAESNNTEMFRQLCYKGVVITDIQPARTAVDKKNTDILTLCLENGIMANDIVEYAVKANDKASVITCMYYGADENIALTASVNANYLEIAEMLLEVYGAVPVGLVATAVGNGNKELVKKLIEFGDVPESGMTPAVEYANLPILTMLVEEFGTNASDQSYIVRAVEFTRNGSHTKIAAYLLSKGADPNNYRENGTGNTLLHLASQRKRTRSPELRKAVREVTGKFARKKVNRDYSMAKILIENGADINAVNNQGWTALHTAVKPARNQKSRDLVRLMVEKGADINACTKNKERVLKIARGCKVKKYLKKAGAGKTGC